MHGRRLIGIQAFSGLALTLFVSLHLFTIVSANLGPHRFDLVLGLTRTVYQFPGFEIGLIAVPLMVHVWASTMRIRERRKRGVTRRAPPLPLRIHRYAAYFLLLVIVGHAGATRLVPLAYGVQFDAAGVGFTLQNYPALFYPYYILLALAGAYHAAFGTTMALATLRSGSGGAKAIRLRPATLGRAMVVLGALVVGALLGLGGVTYEVGDTEGSGYGRLFRALTTGATWRG